MSTISYRAPIFVTTTAARCALFGICSIAMMSGSLAHAVTPESPEVRAVIDKGLKYLEAKTDERLGGKCLVALAFLKNGAPDDHKRIVEAVEACKARTSEAIRQDDMYSNGLAIIFLSELNPVKYRDMIERFAGVLKARQKSHGGWGYDSYDTGDTSQTQYATLAYWQLMQSGIAPAVESAEAGANWLLRTQDPSGAWGYQGIDPGSFTLQKQERPTLSMLSAGLGSTLIFANILGTLNPGESPQDGQMMSVEKEEVPKALRAADSHNVKKIKTLSGGKLDKQRVVEAVARGQKAFDVRFKEFSSSEYPLYVLYSIERYKSFEEFLTGEAQEEPSWYNEGFQFVKGKQAEDGSLNCPSGQPCATAFAILFLVRSTQKSIRMHLGEGTLVGGRGLSADLSRMKVKKGRLVKERKATDVDNLLAMLEGDQNEKLDALLGDAIEIDVKTLGPEEARRLEQLIKTGSAETRLLAVEAISKLRDLDHVPSLLYALTDPDKRVVRAARDGLEFVSRRFEGFGPPDNFTETERYDALDKWKNWYRSIRPNAPAVR
jgi:hypothetical protein